MFYKTFLYQSFQFVFYTSLDIFTTPVLLPETIDTIYFLILGPVRSGKGSVYYCLLSLLILLSRDKTRVGNLLLIYGRIVLVNLFTPILTVLLVMYSFLLFLLFTRKSHEIRRCGLFNIRSLYLFQSIHQYFRNN